MKLDLEATWRKHRPFILKTSGGLVAFLILLSVASDYADVSDAQKRNARSIENLEESMELLNLSYSLALKKGDALEVELDELLALVAVRGDSGVKMPEGNYAVDFAGQKDQILNRAQTRASPLGLDIRDLHPNFALAVDLTDEEWEDRYRQLEVMRRVLRACTTHAVPVVAAIRPQAIQQLSVPGSPDQVVRRYPVQFELSASYEQYMGLLATFQQAGQTLSVEISKLELDDDQAKRGYLRGVITFVGFDLGTAREQRKPGRGGFRRR